jgi:hypothetical protein
MNPAYIYSKTLIPTPILPSPHPAAALPRRPQPPPSSMGRRILPPPLLRRRWTGSGRRPSMASALRALLPATLPRAALSAPPGGKLPSSPLPPAHRPTSPLPWPCCRGVGWWIGGGELGRRGVGAGGGGGGAGGGCRGGGLRGLVCSQARPRSDVIYLCVFIDLICLYVMD